MRNLLMLNISLPLMFIHVLQYIGVGAYTRVNRDAFRDVCLMLCSRAVWVALISMHHRTLKKAKIQHHRSVPVPHHDNPDVFLILPIVCGLTVSNRVRRKLVLLMVGHPTAIFVNIRGNAWDRAYVSKFRLATRKLQTTSYRPYDNLILENRQTRRRSGPSMESVKSTLLPCWLLKQECVWLPPF